jgi:hypothetical protein
MKNHGSALASRNAAMQHCSMSTTLPLNKRGGLTLPPSLRRKMGLDKLRNPMVVVEERDGGLFLQAAVAMPVRDLPKGTIEQWIARDEADMAAFRSTPRKAKRWGSSSTPASCWLLRARAVALHAFSSPKRPPKVAESTFGKETEAWKRFKEAYEGSINTKNLTVTREMIQK